MTTQTTQPANETPSRRRRWPWVVAIALVLFAVGVFAGGLFRPYVFNGTILQSSAEAPPMDGLVYSDGTGVDVTALRGDVVLIYFGYTYCPDLCPAMLSTIDKALAELGADAGRVTTILVTVDPARDSMESVGDYARLFNDDFRGVWGTEEQVRSVATLYGVTFTYDEPDDEGRYLVAHTASLIGVDTEGVLRILWPAGTTTAELGSDLAELLR